MIKFANLKKDEKEIVKFTETVDVNGVKIFKVFHERGFKYIVMTDESFNKLYNILEDYI